MIMTKPYNTDTIYMDYMYGYPHKTAYHPLTIEESKASQYYLNTLVSIDLYVHIPFCDKKCGFCNLFSITQQSELIYDRYLDAIEQQLKELPITTLMINQVIIGGGTPLILSAKQLERLFIMLDDHIQGGLKTCYTAIETAPKQTTPEKVALLAEWHINRVSIGIQSFHDDELKQLKRPHLQADITHSLHCLSSHPFPQRNIDLIYGLTGQTLSSLARSLEHTLDWHPDEIFIYPLYTRTNAHLSTQQRSADSYHMYLFLREKLLSHGFNQLSMRHFSRDQNQSTLNCGFENILALGVGGRSYLGNIHLCEPYSNNARIATKAIEDFIQRPIKTRHDFGFILNLDEQKRRYLLKNLLATTGIDSQDYTHHFYSDLFHDFPHLNTLIEQHYCHYNDNRLTLTALGLSLSDYIGPQFISDQVKTYMHPQGIKI